MAQTLYDMIPADRKEIEFDFDGDIPWENGVDTGRALLPLDQDLALFSTLSDDEKHAASWALGLLSASAIKEHEKILNELRLVAYPEKRPEGVQFFLEEAIHSAAYQRFLDLCAAELNLTQKELSSFLPSYPKHSLSGRLFALEAKLGGNAIWWAVAATEEESIRLFQRMSSHKEMIDPVFFQLNRLHFLEESRHSSFSYKMIRRKKSPAKMFLCKFSFLASRVLQTVWLFRELSSFRKVRNFRQRHPLLENMATLSEKIDKLSFREKIRLVMKDISYTRIMNRPEGHPRLRRALEQENIYFLRSR